MVEVADDGQTFVSSPVDVLPPGEGTFHRLREGAFVTYKKTWNRYFLWVSGDNTWESNGYAVSVFWSDDPVSGFAPIPGDPTILRPNHVWDAPGHNCIIEDAVGNDWMLYHAVDRKIHSYRERRSFCGTCVWSGVVLGSRLALYSNGLPIPHRAGKSYSDETIGLAWSLFEYSIIPNE